MYWQFSVSFHKHVLNRHVVLYCTLSRRCDFMNLKLSCLLCSGPAYTRAATSDVEVVQFFTGSNLQAPVLPPRERRSTSILHWKDPAPSPPGQRPWTGGNVFSDSSVFEFFGRSYQPSGGDAVISATSDGHSSQPLLYHQDDATSPGGNLVPCTSSSSRTVVWEDGCGDRYNQGFDSLANSYSVGLSSPARSNVVADSNDLFQTVIDTTIPSRSPTGVDSRVTGVNGDGLSSFCSGSHMQDSVGSTSAEDVQNVGLWKRFDSNAWQMEQEKLKQMSLDLPAESDSKDDQLPDLSSSNRLSVTALQLYDTIYGGQSTSSVHRMPSIRSLSSLWMREQNQHAAHGTDQSADSDSKQNSERGPCPAIHRAVEAEWQAKGSDAYSRNVCESEDGNSQSSPSGYLPQIQLVQQESSAEYSPVTEEKCKYTSKTSCGIPETFVPTNDVDAGLAAKAISSLGLSEKEVYGTDSSYVGDYRYQISATSTNVPHSDVLQTAAEDAVLARRPSIKELKSRFEAGTSREASQLPTSSSTAARRGQFESASLKVGRKSFQGSTDYAPGQRQRRKPSLDEGQTNDFVASASTCADNGSKNSAAKGRFVTRASIAPKAIVNLPVLSSKPDIDETEHRQFERLVDRRKMFEAAGTQPVA